MTKIKIAAIIAEFNPLHDGHRYIIKRSRELTGASHILVVLSGNFVQRAEPAIIDKHRRAEAAILAGADAVIEIPAAFATGNAEVFAKAGVKLAASFPHVNYLVFGTESKDISIIRQIAKAQVTKQKEFEHFMTGHLKKGISFDRARCEVVKKLLPQIPAATIERTMTGSNNILGIEYLKELTRLDCGIVPIGVKRTTAISATECRRQLLLAGPLAVPQFADCLTPQQYSTFGSTVLFALMTRLDKTIYNANEELVNLIRNLHPTSYRQLKEQAPTKRFSVSRIVRLALHSALQVTKKDVEHLYRNEWLPYTNLLAIRANADSLFSALATSSRTPLIVRGNKVKPKPGPYLRALQKIDGRANLLYEAISGEKVSTRPVFVLREHYEGVETFAGGNDGD